MRNGTNEARFSQLLRHFIDEETVSFDIFKLDGKAEKSVMPNVGGSASSNKTHFYQIDHQQNNQANVSNLLPFDGFQNNENSLEVRTKKFSFLERRCNL